MVEKAKMTIKQKAAVLEQGQELESDKKQSLEELEESMAELQAPMDEPTTKVQSKRSGNRQMNKCQL